MTQAGNQQWSFAQFFDGFNNQDPDYVDNALLDMINHMQQIELFKEIENHEEVIPKMISRVLSLKDYLHMPHLVSIFNSFIKIIKLFAEKIPVQLLPLLYTKLLAHLESPQYDFFPLVADAVKDTISSGFNYSDERKNVISECLIDKLIPFISNESTRQEFKVFSLVLFNLVIEYFTNNLTEQNISNINNVVQKQLIILDSQKDTQNMDYFTIFKSLTSISKIYVTLIDDKKRQDFLTFIENLKNKQLSATILSNMIEYAPQLFDTVDERPEKYTFVHYQELIMEQLKNPIKKDYNIVYVTFVTSCLSALTVLIHKYSSKITQEQAEKYALTDLEYITLGVVRRVSQSQDDDVILNIKISGEEDEDQWEPVKTTTVVNDSWMIRVAAIKLGIALIQEKSDTFEDKLFGLDSEEEDQELINYIDLLINDSASQTKNDVMNFFRAVVHQYKEDIDFEMIEAWILPIIDDYFTQGTGEDILDLLIKSVALIMNETETALTPETAVNAINNIKEISKETNIKSTFLFITYLVKYSSSEEIIEPLIELVEKLLSIAKGQNLSTCFTIVSRIYYYYYKKSKKESSLDSALNKLNETVIKSLDVKGEPNSYAITAISVFVSCCQGLPSVQNSVDLIVSNLDDSNLAKDSVAALILISTSKSSQCLVKNIKTVIDKLKNNLSLDYITSINSLWAIDIMLKKEIIKLNELESIVDSLFETAINRNTADIQILCLKILNQCYSKGCDSAKLCSLVEFLSTMPLNYRIVNEVGDLVLSSSKTSLDNVKPFVDSLAKKVESGRLGSNESDSLTIISNIAMIIGLASSVNNEYQLSQLSFYKQHLNDQGLFKIFAIKCIGEIGSHFDLSASNADLVDTIIGLVGDAERSVFVSAAESVGLMSISSPSNVLVKFLKSGESSQNVTPYLFGINMYVRRCNYTKERLPKELLEQIVNSVPLVTDFLLPHSKDSFSDIAQTVSECLAGLVGISFNCTEKLIENASYITIKAIYIYLEQYSAYCNKRNLNDKEKEEVKSLIQKISKNVWSACASKDDPMLRYGQMLCVKFAITKNLTKDKKFLGMVTSLLIDNVEKKSSHLIIQKIGGDCVEKFIGVPLRMTSLICIELLIHSDNPEHFDYLNIVRTVWNSVNNEYKTQPTLTQKGLDILTYLASSSDKIANVVTDCQFCEHQTENDVLRDVDEFALSGAIKENSVPIEFKASYYRALLTFLSVKSLSSLKRKEIEKLIMKNQRNPVMTRVREELKSRDVVQSDASLFSNDYISGILMDEFYPEAASIFVG